MGVPYTIPTNLITGALEEDPNVVAKYGPFKQPDIDSRPWIETLRRLLNDPTVYEDIRKRGRERAVEYICSLKHDMYEEHLRDALKRRMVREGRVLLC